MAAYLGIDTSNYTTSAALYDGESNTIKQVKKLLPVKHGELGLKQSDAVFEHIRQLPEIITELSKHIDCEKVSAVGCSVRPRDEVGSYMPCFLAGKCAASCIASVNNIPLYTFSHQAGHIVAALYSEGKLELLNHPFIAFHVSGGTTDCLLISPSETNIIGIEHLAGSLDLKAGQAVDRVGGMLGLPFPAGPSLERFALESTAEYKISPTLKDMDCCLSGLQNKCEQMLKDGAQHCDVALFCIEYIKATLEKMTDLALKKYGKLPLLFAGGVMSNSIIREYFSQKYGAHFASPEYSSDNAAGIAILTMLTEKIHA